MNSSSSWLKTTGVRRERRLFYITSLSPKRSLHQDTLGGYVLSTASTVSCFPRAMLYSCGYCSLIGVFPNQISSQNITCDPFWIMKVPNLRKSRFTFIKLAQKWESPLFHWTWTKGLVPRYLLRRICCHVPSVFNSRHSHLLSRAVFFNSRLCMSRLPCSFGSHRISHLAKRYFLLCSSHCQKNWERK